MIARQIWALENRKRYVCKHCSYRTHNRAIFERHKGTTKHWLRAEFAVEAPRDIRVLVASFLPYYKIRKCGRIAADAFNMKIPKDSIWRIRGDPEDPHAQTCAAVIRLIHNSQTPVYASLFL